MARQARFILAGFAHLVRQRGHNAGAVAHDAVDQQRWLDILRDVAATHKVVLHGWSLQATEYRLLLRPPSAQALSRMIQDLGRRYVAAFNARHPVGGSLPVRGGGGRRTGTGGAGLRRAGRAAVARGIERGAPSGGYARCRHRRSAGLLGAGQYTVRSPHGLAPAPGSRPGRHVSRSCAGCLVDGPPLGGSTDPDGAAALDGHAAEAASAGAPAPRVAAAWPAAAGLLRRPRAAGTTRAWRHDGPWPRAKRTRRWPAELEAWHANCDSSRHPAGDRRCAWGHAFVMSPIN